MTAPIERTVIWDVGSACWRDKVTGVDVKGMGRPLLTTSGTGFYQSEAEGSSQSSDDISDVQALIEAVREDWLPALERKLTERLQGIARDEIAHFLAGHTARTQMYFCEPDKLATVAFVLEQNANDRYIGDTIYNHSVRIARLEVPWWKRWFSR